MKRISFVLVLALAAAVLTGTARAAQESDAGTSDPQLMDLQATTGAQQMELIQKDPIIIETERMRAVEGAVSEKLFGIKMEEKPMLLRSGEIVPRMGRVYRPGTGVVSSSAEDYFATFVPTGGRQVSLRPLRSLQQGYRSRGIAHAR